MGKAETKEIVSEDEGKGLSISNFIVATLLKR